MKDFFSQRHAELTQLATERGIDWASRLSTVPTIDVLRLAALATLLRLDVRRVLNPQQSLSDLAASQGDRPDAGISYLEHLLFHGSSRKAE
jgi:hypothetical protein